jgi:hypothetical protein
MEFCRFAEDEFVVGTLKGYLERFRVGFLRTLETLAHQDLVLLFGEVDRADAWIHVHGFVELESPVRGDATERCRGSDLVFLGMDDLFQGLFRFRKGLDVVGEENLFIEPALFERVVAVVVLKERKSAPVEEVGR